MHSRLGLVGAAKAPVFTSEKPLSGRTARDYLDPIEPIVEVEGLIGGPGFPRDSTVKPPVANHWCIGAAIRRYRASPQFEKLKPSSRATYDCALKEMRDLIGDARLCDLDVDTVDIYSERVAKDHGPGMAHIHVVMIGNIWKACRKHPEFKLKGKTNPTLEAEKYRKVRNPYKPWAEDAQKLFMETAPEELKLAKLLLHFSGQRGGDAVKMRWADFDGEGIFVLPEKTATADDPEPKYSLCPKPLLDALLARKKKGNLGEFILTNAWGKPWANAKTLSIAIRRHLMKIGLVRKGTRTITMHGLRKNAASDVSALLVGSAGVKSVTHHKSNAMADYYAKHAEQIAMNRKVVEKWNEAIAEKSERSAAKRRATLKRVK